MISRDALAAEICKLGILKAVLQSRALANVPIDLAMVKYLSMSASVSEFLSVPSGNQLRISSPCCEIGISI